MIISINPDSFQVKCICVRYKDGNVGDYTYKKSADDAMVQAFQSVLLGGNLLRS